MNRNNILKIIILIIIIANIMLVVDKFVFPWVNNYSIKKQYEKNMEEELNNRKDEEEIEIVEEEQQEFVYNEYEDLLLKDEKERMRYYIGKYIKFINNCQYEEAYNLLYDNFKKEKFPTLESFIEYAKGKYYTENYVDYGDMQRYGYYYFYSVKIGDFKSIENEEKIFSTVFVLKEQDILDFKISFGI